jgi:hypothetical protein
VTGCGGLFFLSFIAACDVSRPVRWRSIGVPSASASLPSQTPAGGSADVALRGTSDTDATNSVTTSATSFADLGDHITRLKRRERHGLGRCGKNQGKSNGGQPEHFFLPCKAFKKSRNLEAITMNALMNGT